MHGFDLVPGCKQWAAALLCILRCPYKSSVVFALKQLHKVRPTT